MTTRILENASTWLVCGRRMGNILPPRDPDDDDDENEEDEADEEEEPAVIREPDE